MYKLNNLFFIPLIWDSFIQNTQFVSAVFQDDIEAYKTQSKFLNSEIYQLTRLWQNSSEQEKCLMVKVRACHCHLVKNLKNFHLHLGS